MNRRYEVIVSDETESDKISLAESESSSSSEDNLFGTQPFIMDIHEITKNPTNAVVKKTKKIKKKKRRRSQASVSSDSNSVADEKPGSMKQAAEVDQDEFFDAHGSFNTIPEDQVSDANVKLVTKKNQDAVSLDSEFINSKQLKSNSDAKSHPTKQSSTVKNLKAPSEQSSKVLASEHKEIIDMKALKLNSAELDLDLDIIAPPTKSPSAAQDSPALPINPPFIEKDSREQLAKSPSAVKDTVSPNKLPSDAKDSKALPTKLPSTTKDSKVPPTKSPSAAKDSKPLPIKSPSEAKDSKPLPKKSPSEAKNSKAPTKSLSAPKDSKTLPIKSPSEAKDSKAPRKSPSAALESNASPKTPSESQEAVQTNTKNSKDLPDNLPSETYYNKDISKLPIIAEDNYPLDAQMKTQNSEDTPLKRPLKIPETTSEVRSILNTPSQAQDHNEKNPKIKENEPSQNQVQKKTSAITVNIGQQ